MAYQNNHYGGYPPPPPSGGGYYQPPPAPAHTPPQHQYSQPPPAQHHQSQNDPFRSYYADRLRQLTFNSRPLIQELSIMAMQQRDRGDWGNMTAVVEELEQAVLRAPPAGKLPLLYLIDSISKNVGGPYTSHLLPPIIPRLYVRTYREVDGHTKSRMDEVIKLWGNTGPHSSPLYGPGVKESVEAQIYGPSGVPISRQQVLALLDSTLAAKRREAQYNPAAHSQLSILSQIGDVVNTQNVSSQELAQIMEQLKAMGQPALPPPGVPPMSRPQPQQHHAAVTDHYPPIPPQQHQNRPPFPPNPNTAHIPSPMGAGLPPPPFPPHMGRETYRGTPPQPYPSAIPTPPHPGQSSTPQPPPAAAPLPLDVAKLLQTINAGSLSKARTPEPKSALEAYEEMIIDMDVRLSIVDMNLPRSLPSSQLPERCRTCGIRMPEGEEKMQAHMDWHFRRNRKDREGQGRGAHRKWLPKNDEWANEAPQAGPSGSTGRDSTPSSGPKLTLAKLQQLRTRWVRVPQDPIKKSKPCPVCKEAFKPEWDEGEEEWVYRNAIDINGTIYHATCRAEQMSLSKLIKEEGKRSKSASPKATPGPETNGTGTGNAGVKVEKRKQEEGGGEDDLAKRAKIDLEGANGVVLETETPQTPTHSAPLSVSTNQPLGAPATSPAPSTSSHHDSTQPNPTSNSNMTESEPVVDTSVTQEVQVESQNRPMDTVNINAGHATLNNERNAEDDPDPNGMTSSTSPNGDVPKSDPVQNVDEIVVDEA